MANVKTPQTRTPTNKMLIDATHPEETRVVVLRDNRVEEFDYESAARKLLRGNIYLAKVTRVEPSLQAAFVDYGGNRHGFLAFNEIHPDYYQIPVADRRALLEAEAAEEAEAAALADAEAESRHDREKLELQEDTAEQYAVEVADLLPAEPAQLTDDRTPDQRADFEVDDISELRGATTDGHRLRSADISGRDPQLEARSIDENRWDSGVDSGSPNLPTVATPDGAPAAAISNDGVVDCSDAPRPVGLVEDEGVMVVDGSENGNGDLVEEVSGAASEDALEELPSRPRRRMRSYKIQEVIKRKQIILVQVVKEERGTKGAALTTYLSLAGRYTVLMPNTARGGGISRKITNPQDRKRLKAIADELDVPMGMGLIIRTAGASRTKQEIRRDFEYLLRLWESVREFTLQSTAPALVYEEGNLVKRSIRDLYGKEVEEIVVAGEPAFREARDFMRMLMPSHVKNVAQYSGSEPLFTSFQIERQLNAMFSPYVYLKSGGYLVINQTEALVAIDVNSGKSTREFSIEETALNTNLEAAEELARQLKLRDLAGLIVVDFIDMEEKRNNRAVERRLKDALRNDRARIQIGHISHFGLLEMSRQRMRTGVLEGSTTQCPHCQGTGIIRSTESVALGVLRALEDALTNNRPAPLIANTTTSVALYLLNNKRQFINDMEQRYGVSITVMASDKLEGSDFSIEQSAATRLADRPATSSAVSMDWSFDREDTQETEGDGEQREADGRRRNRRRRRRGRRDDTGGRDNDNRHVSASQDDEQAPDEDARDPADIGHDYDSLDGTSEVLTAAEPLLNVDGEGSGRGRRRGRRGGRRNRRGRAGAPPHLAGETPESSDRPEVEIEFNADRRDSSLDYAPAALDQPEINGAGCASAQPHQHAADDDVVEANTGRVFEPTDRDRPQVNATVAENDSSSSTRDFRIDQTPTDLERPRFPTASKPGDGPLIEQFQIGQDQQPEVASQPVDISPPPTRRGWWQRRIGGGG